MGWLDLFKKKEKEKEEEFDEDDNIVRLCQGCGLKEDIEKDVTLRKLKQQTTDGLYEFLFCRKCYRMMKKGKLPPLIAQMQSQQRGRR